MFSFEDEDIDRFSLFGVSIPVIFLSFVLLFGLFTFSVFFKQMKTDVCKKPIIIFQQMKTYNNF